MKEEPLRRAVEDTPHERTQLTSPGELAADGQPHDRARARERQLVARARGRAARRRAGRAAAHGAGHHLARARDGAPAARAVTPRGEQAPYSGVHRPTLNHDAPAPFEVLTLSFSENATAWRRADDDDDGGGGDDYACVRARALCCSRLSNGTATLWCLMRHYKFIKKPSKFCLGCPYVNAC